MEKVMKRYSYKDWDSVLASIGHGGLKEGQVVNRMLDEYQRDHKKKITDAKVLEAAGEANKDKEKLHIVKSKSGIVVRGIDDVAVRFSKCCSPVPGDEIIGMQLQTQGSDLLIVSENGMGKRTNMDEFTVQKRGGKGVKCYKIVEKTGDVVGAKAVNDDNEIMMITTEGIIIQLRVQDISTLSRITSGVKLINLDEGVKVAQIAKVREKLSNGDHEFDNLEEAMEEVAQEAVSEDEEEAEENLIFPTEDSEDDE